MTHKERKRKRKLQEIINEDKQVPKEDQQEQGEDEEEEEETDEAKHVTKKVKKECGILLNHSGWVHLLPHQHHLQKKKKKI